MELIVRIVSQGALEEREYPNKQTGTPEKFATMPFVLQQGDDTFYCEMIQDQARRQAQLSQDYYYKASLTCRCVEVKQKESGKTFLKQHMTLNKICVL